VAAKVVEEIAAEAANDATAEAGIVIQYKLLVALLRHLLVLKLQQKKISDGNTAEVAQEKNVSKGIVIREPATSQSREQAVPKDVSSKKTVRKTRAKRKRSAAGIIPAVEVPKVEHMGSEMEVIPSIEIEDDIPDIEGTFAQDPNDNAPLEDMADVHDSYDAVLADFQEENVQSAVPKLEVTSPAIKNTSPTKIGKLVSCYPLLLLFGLSCIYNSASWS
jgi:hypothetical protein